MGKRVVARSVLVSLALGIQTCLGAEISADLIQKVEQLEKELLALKKEHQERLQAQPVEADVKTVAAQPAPLEMDAKTVAAQSASLEKSEKSKASPKLEGAEKEPQATPNSGQAEELYTQAQIFLNQKHPDQAKTILTNLCESYPESPSYILAKYWLGEISLAAHDNTHASIAYGEAYSNYKERLGSKEPLSDEVRNRAIESLAKLAFCLKQLNKRQDACVTLEQFSKEIKEASTIPYNIQRFALQVSDQLKCQKKPQL